MTSCIESCVRRSYRMGRDLVGATRHNAMSFEHQHDPIEHVEFYSDFIGTNGSSVVYGVLCARSDASARNLMFTRLAELLGTAGDHALGFCRRVNVADHFRQYADCVATFRQLCGRASPGDVRVSVSDRSAGRRALDVEMDMIPAIASGALGPVDVNGVDNMMTATVLVRIGHCLHRIEALRIADAGEDYDRALATLCRDIMERMIAVMDDIAANTPSAFGSFDMWVRASQVEFPESSLTKIVAALAGGA